MKAWNSLPQYIQDTYIKKAKYLIERGYVLDKDVEDLAAIIYEKEKN
jgi:hypothetical protein